eukprot:gene20838-27006_t
MSDEFAFTERRSEFSGNSCYHVSPTLRANPFPEVTDLFCRLPLPTLIYGLEAAHLGDLRRFTQ